MKAALVALAFLFATIAQAQVCDVKYVVDVNTATNDVTTATTQMYGVPVADLDDNSKRGRTVLDVASKMQDKGGDYEVEFGEWRTCDGKTVQNMANSLMVKGVTLKGANQINKQALKVANEILDRYIKRGEKGDRDAWDHKKAKKLKRDDLGHKVKD